MANTLLSNIIEDKADRYIALSDAVWATPELAFSEHRSSELHGEALTLEGFAVETGVANLPTAIRAQAGDGGPTIAFLGEFDALPGLSQIAGQTQAEPMLAGGNGHGCGHNLLGAASLLAAAGVKAYLEQTGTPGQVLYFGCPAEESGSGKSYLVREGLFDQVDTAICWHPAPFTGVNRPFSLACAEFEFAFTGKAAHASSSPELGRSALDAVELMHVGINYLREHMNSTSRIHYAIVDAGSAAPNVVQAHAVSRQMIRAESLEEMWQLVERVSDIARGAALMTGTTMALRQVGGDANLVANDVLESAMFEVISALGAPPFDESDETAAAAFTQTFSDQDVQAAAHRFGLTVIEGEWLSRRIFPLGAGSSFAVGSTDVGTVSWVAPTVQCRVACYAVGTPGHSWQLVAQGKLSAAHKGMIHAAKIMAETAVKLIEDPELLADSKNEHAKRLDGQTFRNPIGPEADPMARHT
jgi:aminobenzoyl-glutamate utilization protein B